MLVRCRKLLVLLLLIAGVLYLPARGQVLNVSGGPSFWLGNKTAGPGLIGLYAKPMLQFSETIHVGLTTGVGYGSEEASTENGGLEGKQRVLVVPLLLTGEYHYALDINTELYGGIGVGAYYLQQSFTGQLGSSLEDDSPTTTEPALSLNLGGQLLVGNNTLADMALGYDFIFMPGAPGYLTLRLGVRYVFN